AGFQPHSVQENRVEGQAAGEKGVSAVDGMLTLVEGGINIEMLETQVGPGMAIIDLVKDQKLQGDKEGKTSTETQENAIGSLKFVCSG
ncbi:unnamed protein product, partial [Choristocarpus tenellus]